MSSCEGIEPNADIAGVGIRIATYSSAILNIMPTLLFLSKGDVTSYERKILDQIFVNTLIPALAVLVNAFIQANTFGISAYHALIILNLSWVNGIGAAVWFFNNFSSRPSTAFGITNFFSKNLMPSLINRASLLASMQQCLMGAFGIWFWARIAVFGHQPQCTPQTLASVFFQSRSLANKRLRITSLVFYSIAAIPIVNLLLLFVLLLFLSACFVACVVAVLKRRLPDTPIDSDKLSYISVTLCGALLDILFAVDTELTIRWNRGQVERGEEVWGFGQTLAVLVVLLPAIDIAQQILTWNQRRKAGAGQLAPAIANGFVRVIRHDNLKEAIVTFYVGADNHIYISSRSPTSESPDNRRISSVEARACTPIAAISWSSSKRGESECIRVYYIDQGGNIREVGSSDGGTNFTDRPEPIAKAAQNSGVLYATANSESKVPWITRVGFNSASNPTSITEVVLKSQKDSPVSTWVVEAPGDDYKKKSEDRDDSTHI